MLTRILGQDPQVPAALNKVQKRPGQIPPVFRVKFQEGFQNAAGVPGKALVIQDGKQYLVDAKPCVILIGNGLQNRILPL